MQELILTAELIEEEEGGYTVYCPELDIYTQGDNEEECMTNIKEAIELHLEEIGKENVVLKKIIRKELRLAI